MHGLFYNLKKKPFQLEHDPTHFFESSGQKRALSYLHYGLTQREGFVVITGESGVGKTMLSHVFCRGLNKENTVVALIVFDVSGAEDALRLISKAFSLPYENLSRVTLLKNLEVFFLEQVKNGKQVLLVVDEVQRLSIRLLEELRMLSNFTLEGRAFLQTFLLGGVDFQETLQDENLEQLRQRVIAAYQLESMSEEEARAYIESQLQYAGWQGESMFDAAAYAKIYEYSRGVPKKINTLCECILHLGSKNKLNKIDGDLVQKAIEEIKGGFSLAETPVKYVKDKYSCNQPISKSNRDDLEVRLTALEKRMTELEEQLKKEQDITNEPRIERTVLNEK